MNKIKGRNKIKTNKGITLIALVITIIILLILATISIATLTGENGILNKADNAKIEEEKSSAKEKVQIAVMGSFGNDGNISKSELKTNLDKVEGIKKPIPDIIKLPTTVKVDGYEVTINEDGKVTLGESTGEKPTPNPPTLDLPSTEDTTPYLPERATINEEHNTLEKGLVIKDENNNEWVWIEVPKSIYRGTTTSTDYTDIETTLQTYAKDYRESGYVDKFHSTAQHGFTNATEYNNYKNSMLKSVYENGGFYIGRYETGTKTARFSSSANLTTPIIKRDVYPYNFVTCSQSQTLSEQLSTGGKTGSLMFGIQWDLVFEFLKTKGLLNGTISEWGNSQDASFDITRGQYTNTPDVPNSWQDASSYTKNEGISVLLTTGASDRNSVLGIYDLVGNLAEVTLEYTGKSTYPCAYRGNGYYRGSVVYPAYAHTYDSTTASSKIEGFRSTLW